MAAFILGLVVAVLVNIVTAVIDREKGLKLLPWLAAYVFLHGWVALLTSDQVEGIAVKFPGHSHWVTYAVLMFVGASVTGLAWKVTTGAVDKLAKATEPLKPDETKTDSTAPALPPAVSVPVPVTSPVAQGKPILNFDGSKLLTQHRKDLIIREINSFHEYLLSLQVAVADEPVRVYAFEGSKTSFQNSYGNDGAVYNNGVGIPNEGIDDLKTIVEAYSQYVFSRLAVRESRYKYQDTPFDESNPRPRQDSKELVEFRFRTGLSKTVAAYLTESYLGKPEKGKDPCLYGPNPGMFFPSVYWWDIENAFDKNFANNLAVSTVLAAQKNPVTDAKMTMYEFMAERIQIAQGFYPDKDQAARIRKILNRCGFLDKASKQTSR